MTKAHINGKNRLIFLLTLVIGIMVLIVASKYAFQRACSRREIHWPDLEIADEWQYKIITEAYKIKNEPNREITITASDGVKLVGHYFERKKNAPIIIFFHGLWSDSYAVRRQCSEWTPIYGCHFRMRYLLADTGVAEKNECSLDGSVYCVHSI